MDIMLTVSYSLKIPKDKWNWRWIWKMRNLSGS